MPSITGAMGVKDENGILVNVGEVQPTSVMNVTNENGVMVNVGEMQVQQTGVAEMTGVAAAAAATAADASTAASGVGVNVNVGMGVGVGVDASVNAAAALTKNIPGARIVERRRKGWVKKTWDERLEELKTYKRSHGDTNVPTLSKENPLLGEYVILCILNLYDDKLIYVKYLIFSFSSL